MNLDFSTLYALWATDFFQKNEILLLCFGVIILLLLVIMIVVSINKTKRLKTLQQLNEVAEESNQLKNAFIANMTHEIRTPLNAIVGFTNVLAETDNLSREERMIFLKEINDNKNFLVQMINDLLDFSKIEANTMEYKDGDVDVNALIQEICAAENAHPRPSGIQIEFVEKLPQCRLMIDRVRFAQVINNLVKNALKFTEQGSVRIGYRRLSNDSFYFYVADTGCGIYNPQIQISAESETKRSIFREKDKTKRSKKESAQHSKSRNKSFVMTSVSAL